SRFQRLPQQYESIGAEIRRLRPRKVKDWGDRSNLRLDMNPAAVELARPASHLYFCLEGCIKADAILSAGGAVFSVPSVSMWDCDELPAFAAEYLQGVDVVIVCDADWVANPEVWKQALLCRSRLRSLAGVGRVCIAAPPVTGLPDLKGVDDYLGKG